MQLVMDGVGRGGGVINLGSGVAMPQRRRPVVPQPQPQPQPQASVRLDGMSRRVLAPPQPLTRPRYDAQQPPFAPTTPLLAVSRPAPSLQLPTLPSPGQLWNRTGVRTAAFTIVATGLVLGAVAVGHNVTLARTVADATTATHGSVASGATETMVAQAAASARAVGQQQSALTGLLNEFTATHGSTYSLYVKDLKTGATATVNPDASMTSASLYKLFVAQQIYKQVEVGKLVYAGDAGGDSSRSIDGCLALMINISDNTCGRALGSILNWQEQDALLKADGYTGTTLATPQQTTPRDVAHLFERLYDGTLLTTEATARFMNLLQGQKVNDRLPTGVPVDTIMAHKTGDLDGYMHDAGVVKGTKTDYLVVMMGAPGAKAADFTELSTKLWSFFEN